MNFFFGILLGLATLGAPVTAFAEVSVIVNSAQKAPADLEQVRLIFLGKARRWPDGSALKPLDLPVGSTTRNEFYQELLEKSDLEMKMYWSTTIFTGAGTPPKLLGSDNETLKFVEENPNAIGYVNSASVRSGVKVLLTIK
jgi:ABC-type phosphate transport system substrate-binding protein